MHTDDVEALLHLIAACGAAAPRKALLEHFASPTAALAAGTATWRACGLTEPQIAALRRPDADKLHAATRWLEQPGRHLLGWNDPDYPPLLRRCANAPLALFVAGSPALLWHPSIAVVGSRAATPAGLDNARAFARGITAAGFAVTSGLAAGVDAAAHAATLDAGGLTIAVLGTGPDVPYPRTHTGLHARIAEAGAVVSEHLPGTEARAEHFPSRNRILAGLALGTLVVEAAERSGALITARLAAEAGREVLAIPGSIHNPLARGCHRLIADGAVLVDSVQQVIAAVAPAARELAGDLRGRLADSRAAPANPGPPPAPQRRRKGPPRSQTDPMCGDPEYQKLWNALGHDPTDMDQLVQRTGLTPAGLSSMLVLMELDGRVTKQHGRYHRSR
ncbi:DNA-processing protein DprA [Lysobacter yangpyeongensis]|uniref:DNA-processing protein DprA n=1 Tax=Lysobacter yangpyeongensis TaxID=346182 RepID=A0ABW0SML1_9GAMM